MQLHKGLSKTPAFNQGCVLTIGNFDGVHLGHQAVIAKLAERGKELELPVVVMLFEPQPLEYFQTAKAPPRLTSLREKVSQLAKLPVADLVIVRFNKQLATYDAARFVDDILVGKLNVKHLVIGDDFRFGKDRQGDFALLQAKGKSHGFGVEDTGSIQLEGQRVSSTLIRTALADGNLILTKTLLGRPYMACGRVVHGDKRGRTLGYPTANIKFTRVNSPVSGVFAVTLSGIEGRDSGDRSMAFQGVANVGVRPTVAGNHKLALEVHLFDFDQDIYGQQVTVQFEHKIRAEQRFQDLAELKAQIVVDIDAAKHFFATQQP